MYNTISCSKMVRSFFPLVIGDGPIPCSKYVRMGCSLRVVGCNGFSISLVGVDSEASPKSTHLYMSEQ